MKRQSLFLACLLSLAAVAANAQTSCLVQNQGALLQQFSDAATPGSIAPSAVRNVICSGLVFQTAGGAGQTLTPTTSPFTYTFISAGSVIVTSGQVAISRNQGLTFNIASVTGGDFVVQSGDQLRIVWYVPATIPTVTFLPFGPS